jgi:hypothetical protein
VIVITFFIYIRAGRTIYQQRKQLHNFSNSEPEPMPSNFGSVKTTEVFVTSEAAEPPRGAIGLGSMGRRGSEAGSHPRAPGAAYSVTISSNKYGRRESHSDAVLPVQEPVTAPYIQRPPVNNTRRRNFELNNAAWSYTKCALLFFTAILITWIPSSANRVYSVIHTRSASTVLEFMSAFVLPLQGFWNAVIYTVTSWKACKTFFGELTIFNCGSRRAPVRELVGYRGNDVGFKVPSRGGSSKNYETDSMTELANSRPSSHEHRMHR